MNKDMTDWHAESRQLGICEGEFSSGLCNMRRCMHSIVAFRECIFTMTGIYASLTAV